MTVAAPPRRPSRPRAAAQPCDTRPVGVDMVSDALPMTETSDVPTPTTPLPGRVLAIDDDGRLLENFAMALARDGHKVETADTLIEGLRLAATWPFDVCLLDHDIGSDAGIDALPRLAELAPRMRVVMVTANAQVEDAVRVIALGAADYLVKPCSPDQLRIAVMRQIEARRLRDRVDTLEREVSRGTPELVSCTRRCRPPSTWRCRWPPPTPTC